MWKRSCGSNAARLSVSAVVTLHFGWSSRHKKTDDAVRKLMSFLTLLSTHICPCLDSILFNPGYQGEKTQSPS